VIEIKSDACLTPPLAAQRPNYLLYKTISNLQILKPLGYQRCEFSAGSSIIGLQKNH
jgi:hypothetical protein